MAQAIGGDWATPLKHASFGTGYTAQWMTALRARKRRFPCENIAVFWMRSREARAALPLSLEWSANGNLTFPRGGLWSNFRVARDSGGALTAPRIHLVEACRHLTSEKSRGCVRASLQA